ncbi:MAG: NCS2 family permease [Oligoflexia bacterium]|nr:NCS2 family permease [Oligoflexia bacterium]
MSTAAVVQLLDRFFKIKDANSSVRTEILGGLATFLTMSYIIFVNPTILIDAVPGIIKGSEIYNAYFGGFMVATIVGAASATLVMGLFANYPFALAPGMGLNAYFTYTVCLKMGIDWRVALGAVFIESIIFAILTLVGLRAFIVGALPSSVKLGTCAGIGLFLALIGLKGSKIVIGDPNTLVALGHLTSPEALTTIVGFFVMASLFALKIPGSILLGILAAALFGVFAGVTKFVGIVGAIPDVSATFMQLSLPLSSLTTITFWVIVFTFFFADFFDTAGTLTGISNANGMADKDGNLPRASSAFMSDAVGTFLGAIFGTSAITAYIESGAGVAQGARTGLAAVVVAILMLLALFFSPLAMSIPASATAPALIFVGGLMMLTLKEIKWEDVTESVPAFVTIVSMPFTFSIANGIALGMITFVAIKLLTGKMREIHWLTALLSAIFVIHFIFME